MHGLDVRLSVRFWHVYYIWISCRRVRIYRSWLSYLFALLARSYHENNRMDGGAWPDAERGGAARGGGLVTAICGATHPTVIITSQHTGLC